MSGVKELLAEDGDGNIQVKWPQSRLTWRNNKRKLRHLINISRLRKCWKLMQLREKFWIDASSKHLYKAQFP